MTQQQHTKALFAYQTYESLESCLSQQRYSDEEVHIFGLGSLAVKVNQIFNLPVFPFNDIFGVLFDSFYHVETKIYFQSKLRKLIQEGDYTHKKYLINRLSAIVDTFYTIADFGMEQVPNESNDTRREEILKLVNLLLKDETVRDFNNQKRQLTKDKISLRLCGHTRLHRIIFYEVEYLNFARMNLIHYLQRKGFQIEFRIPFRDQYKRTFEFWEKVYEVATNQEIKSTNTTEETITNGERFALFNEGLTSEARDRENVSIYEFDTPHGFQEYYQKTNDYIFSINPDDINTLVSNTHSIPYENSVGKFVYYLQFCSNVDSKIQVSYNQLIELITNKWIRSGNAEGSNALSLMLDLTEYMSGVDTTEDVKERLYHLQELDLVNKSFDRENYEDVGKNRMKRYMLNPFRTFSFLHGERYAVTIKQLIDLIEEFERLCSYLLPDEAELISVNRYFESWQNALHNTVGHEDDGVWERVFSERFPSEWEFAAPELLQLIYLTASRFDSTNANIHALPLQQEKNLEADKDKALHLTNITQMNFPEKHASNSLSQFFNHTDLKNIIQAASSNIKNRLLHALWVDYAVEDNFSKLGLYQLYNILANYDGPVKFSWINNMHEDGIRNIYLEILADLYNDGRIIPYTAHEKLTLSNVPQREGSVENIDIKGFHNKLPGIYWLNHDFCSKKFFLTAFIDQEPIYEQDFHHQFLFSKIGKLFSISKAEAESFRHYIFPMFPHWTFTKKENLIDMEYQTTLRKYKHFENISYPKELKSLQILRSVHRENRRTKARNQYRKDKDFNDKEIMQQFKENISHFNVRAEPGNHCKMCQFLNSCNEGMYAIDSQGY